MLKERTMYLTLALVVFVFSIIVFFSQEFTNIFKKIFAISGAKILLPLAICSWGVYTFDVWFLWGIYYIRDLLHMAVASLMRLLPFQKGAQPIASILLLTLLSVVPSLFIQWLTFRKRYVEFKYPYLTSTIIWITSSILLLIL